MFLKKKKNFLRFSCFELSIAGSSNGSNGKKEKTDRKSASPANSASDSESQQGRRAGSSGSEHSVSTSVSQQQQAMARQLGQLETVPQDISGSRQSFRMAMGNPCEFFVDVMWGIACGLLFKCYLRDSMWLLIEIQ